MNKQERAEKVAEKMLAEDAFSRWLGIEMIEIEPGHAELETEVRYVTTSSFKVAHGGIVFARADSARAIASTTYGRVALALENTIAYIKKVMPGDRLTAKTD